MRHEWKSDERALYVERGADGVIDTNAGPDDLEAHEELLRFVAEWAERFGFLAVEHAPDSLESIDEVAGIISANHERDIEKERAAGERSAALTDRELEIRLLRRERRLLVDLDIVKSNVIAGLLSGEVRQSNLNEIERLQKEVLRLHTDARNGVLLPEGVSCGCLLCAPKRDLQPVDRNAATRELNARGMDDLLDIGEPEKEN